MFKTLNKDYTARDILLFGEYDPTKYSGGIRYFCCCSELMKELIENGFADPKETQNMSPSIEEFLDLAESVEFSDGEVNFNGYAVSPDRSDYRISVEEINLAIPDNNPDLLAQVVSQTRFADEFDIEHGEGKYLIRAWWD